MANSPRFAPRPMGNRLIHLEQVRDTVFINGLALQTVIGIDAEEQDEPQTVVVDLELGIEQLEAGRTDRIADTIDYGAVRRRLIDLAGTHRVKLLEAFAELIAETAMREFGASSARVRVAKPHKFADVNAFGVSIERHRPLGTASAERPPLGLV